MGNGHKKMPGARPARKYSPNRAGYAHLRNGCSIVCQLAMGLDAIMCTYQAYTCVPLSVFLFFPAVQYSTPCRRVHALCNSTGRQVDYSHDSYALERCFEKEVCDLRFPCLLVHGPWHGVRPSADLKPRHPLNILAPLKGGGGWDQKKPLSLNHRGIRAIFTPTQPGLPPATLPIVS